MRKTALQKMVQKVNGERPIEELLRDLYVMRRHTDQEIADAWGVERATVQQWRTQFGVSREERPPVEPLGAA